MNLIDRLRRLDTGGHELESTVALCLPSVIGTAFILTMVLTERFRDRPSFAPVGAASTIEQVLLQIAFPFFIAGYFCAAFGPILVPFGIYQAVRLTTTLGPRARATIVAWVVILLGLLATALFWGWLNQLELLP